jgi:hypothetical protein
VNVSHQVFVKLKSGYELPAIFKAANRLVTIWYKSRKWNMLQVKLNLLNNWKIETKNFRKLITQKTKRQEVNGNLQTLRISNAEKPNFTTLKLSKKPSLWILETLKAKLWKEMKCWKRIVGISYAHLKSICLSKNERHNTGLVWLASFDITHDFMVSQQLILPKEIGYEFRNLTKPKNVGRYWITVMQKRRKKCKRSLIIFG